MFNYIYKKIENRILNLIYTTYDSKIEKIKEHLGEPGAPKMLSYFGMYLYKTEATGLFKEVEQIRDYLNVELVKTEATEKLVDKKNKK